LSDAVGAPDDDSAARASTLWDLLTRESNDVNGTVPVAAQFCHRQGRSIVYFSSRAVSPMEFMAPAHDVVFVPPRPRGEFLRPAHTNNISLMGCSPIFTHR